MLTVAKMGGGKADYYTSLAAEDYYVGAECSLEPSGYWMGKGAARIKLDGKTVKTGEFKNLFHGFSPNGKDNWVNNAGRYKGTERDRMPGFDLTVSAPKSVSICWALGSRDVRRGIEQAQRQAIALMVERIEEKTIIRTGSGGRIKESAGIIAGVFQHGTARQVDKNTPPDMQLHCHITVINTGLSARGMRAALNGQDFLNPTFAKIYGAIYRTELAKGLQKMGFELVSTKDGFEIKGVSRELVEEFSKRKGQIDKSLVKGREGASAKEKLAANHKTREAKREYDPKDLVCLWAKAAETRHQFTSETIDGLRSNEAVKNSQPEVTKEKLGKTASFARGIEKDDNLTEAFREAARRFEAEGSRVIYATWSKAKAEEMEEKTGIKSATVRQLLSDIEVESKAVAKEDEKQSKDIRREIFAHWKYATWQWSKDVRDRYLGKEDMPTSRLAHEIKYATHQISRGHRDFLNRKLKQQEKKKERDGRKIDGATTIIINALKEAAEKSSELQELIKNAQRKGAIVCFSDVLIKAAQSEAQLKQQELERYRERQAIQPTRAL